MDPDRVVTVGDSAGGHLALAATSIVAVPGEGDGASAHSARPELAMALYPVSHVTTPGLEAIDPYSHLDATNAVPTLILHGTADELPATPYSASVAYCARHATLSGAGCTVAPFAGAPHNFFPDPTLYSSATVYLDLFLLDRGWLLGVRADVSTYAFSAAGHCRFSFAQFSSLESEYQLPASADGPVW